ncbi:conserved hypothetical protein [Sphingobacterium sp. PM2-P1-29]|nr:conserved hypothetical protein [Sphingobacterium sp. PM2-P1-29]
MKKIYIILIFISNLGFLSCSKWLDIQPESDVDKNILFSTEDGFKEALIGVYTRSAKSDLYGKEMTIGTAEVLVQNYSIASNDPLRYQQTKNFRYSDANFIARKDNVWKGLYNGIANANLILGEIDKKQNLFIGHNYPLIKGEALALRAYLHFDALRLFATAPIVSDQSDAIPYVTTYSNKSTKLSSVSQVLDSVIRDLEQAKELLKIDPIRQKSYVIGYPTSTDTLQNSELQDPSLFLQNRRHRLNYFAVCGLLARVNLYKGDQIKALAYAKEIIAAKKFPWTNRTDFLAVDADKKDRILYKELLFAWYIPAMSNTFNNEWFTEGNSGMYLDQEEAKIIYDVGGAGGSDMRYTQWFGSTSVGSAFISPLLKYRRNVFSESFSANLHYLVAPAIRLSEMYYIAAECTFGNDPAQALAYLDEVRQNRGIGQKLDMMSQADFRQVLIKEYRKEMYAEGQLFFVYKRLNQPIVGQQGAVIPVNQQVFTWPLPDDEIIYGQR